MWCQCEYLTVKSGVHQVSSELNYEGRESTSASIEWPISYNISPSLHPLLISPVGRANLSNIIQTAQNPKEIN